MAGAEIEALIKQIASLPGLGPRSARRIALSLLRKPDTLLTPLIETLSRTADQVKTCSVCGNFDTQDPCAICTDPRRDPAVLCVVEDVADLWALDRTGAFRGRYHVTGGVLSALDGVGPEDLNLAKLTERASDPLVTEVILALPATVDGQTTAHFIADQLASTGVTISGLAHGVPVGGELDYLDDGTLATALKARRPV